MKKPFLVLIVAMLVFSCNKNDIRRELPSSASKKMEQAYKFFNENANKLPAFEPGVVLVRFRDNVNQRAVPKKQILKRIYTKTMEKKGHNGFYKVMAAPGK